MPFSQEKKQATGVGAIAALVVEHDVATPRVCYQDSFLILTQAYEHK